MVRNLRLRLKLSLLCALLALHVNAPKALAQDTNGQPDRALKVAVRIVPPFVFKEANSLTGFSTELWYALGRELNIKTEFVEKANVPDLLDEVKSGRADLAIAAISITSEREKAFDFSQPMFDAGLQIMVPSNRSQDSSIIPAMLALFTSKAFQELALMMLVLAILPVPLVWLFERKNPEALFKGKSALGSLGKTLWWSSSTVAGQATHMPHTLAGRLIAMVWMFVGVIFISYFTATVTANLTVKQLESGISGPQDLSGKRVAVLKGSTGALAAKAYGASLQEFPQLSDAYEALKSGTVVAMVHDAPILQYYAAHEGKGAAQVTGEIFKPEAYGILMPLGSPLRKPIDAALLHLRESGEYRALYSKWFSASGSGN